MTNAFLPSRYLERVQRGAVALQLWDGARDARLRDALDVLIEHEHKLEPQWARLEAPGRPDDVDPDHGWYRFPKRRTDLHALLYPTPRPSKPKTSLEVRIFDRRWRYSPRRVDVPVPADFDPDFEKRPRVRLRIRRTALYPGPAYGVMSGSTGIRGRVTLGGVPVRWARARVAAAVDEDPPIAVAYGDDRGEFLLIVPGARSTLSGSTGTFQLSVEVSTPPQPSAAMLKAIARDPLADLAMEPMDAAVEIHDPHHGPIFEQPDPKAMGWTWPAAYSVAETRTVTFTAGTIHRERFEL